jgi:hypothetical protein
MGNEMSGIKHPPDLGKLKWLKVWLNAFAQEHLPTRVEV